MLAGSRTHKLVVSNFKSVAGCCSSRFCDRRRAYRRDSSDARVAAAKRREGGKGRGVGNLQAALREFDVNDRGE